MVQEKRERAFVFFGQAPDPAVVRSGLEGGSGAQGRNRTTDTVIFSHVLYQLSYLGAGPAQKDRSAKRGAL